MSVFVDYTTGNPFIQRLENVFHALGTTATRFGNEHQLSRQTVYHIMKGRNIPSTMFLVQICEIEPRVSAEYLLRGEGEPLRDGKSTAGMETVRTLLELQSMVTQFVEKKVKSVQY